MKIDDYKRAFIFKVSLDKEKEANVSKFEITTNNSEWILH